MTVDNFVFHGSGNPVGTSCDVLKKPKFTQPLFVANNPRIAQWYASNHQFGLNHASIFILKLKDNWESSLFDFTNPTNLNELKKAKLPLTMEFLMTDYYKNTFFEAAVDAGIFITNLKYEKTIDGKKDVIIGNRKAYNSCIELGLINADGTFTEKTENFSSDRDIVVGYRRLFKAQIYEALFKRGFKIFKDNDTTGAKLKGSEYAILDISIIEAGVNKSVDMLDVAQVIQNQFNIDIMKEYR